MKTFIKLAAVIALSSGLAACSSSKKEDSSILDDMAKVENSENSESSILSDIEDTSADQQKESTIQ